MAVCADTVRAEPRDAARTPRPEPLCTTVIRPSSPTTIGPSPGLTLLSDPSWCKPCRIVVSVPVTPGAAPSGILPLAASATSFACASRCSRSLLNLANNLCIASAARSRFNSSALSAPLLAAIKAECTASVPRRDVLRGTLPAALAPRDGSGEADGALEESDPPLGPGPPPLPPPPGAGPPPPSGPGPRSLPSSNSVGFVP